MSSSPPNSTKTYLQESETEMTVLELTQVAERVLELVHKLYQVLIHYGGGKERKSREGVIQTWKFRTRRAPAY